MNQDITAVDAKFEAQKLAWGPIYFQAIISLRDLGILGYIHKNRKKGAIISEICKELNISDYGVRVLLEAAEVVKAVEYLDDNTVKLTKTGFYLLNDELTRVNLNYVNDVCYEGAKSLTDCITTGKAEGLKTFGDWDTIYEALASLPPKVKTSWFEFDHYYSSDAFPYALDIVMKEKPKYVFDIGGNTGKWAFACCEHDKDINIKILDLPGQLNVARKNAEEKGFSDRIDFHQINLLDSFQKIPKGADVIWMSQFLDCFSKNEIITILKNVYQAADHNTAIYIMEPFTDNQEFEAAKHSLVGTSLYFTTIANGNSRMYSVKVMIELAEAAGLEVVDEFPLIGNSYHTILKCQKPS